jgi:multicomponent Na+:H+ antiporter subunit F
VIYGAALVGLIVAMVLFLGRALLGPTVYDRILAMNALGTKTVLFVALLGFFAGRPDFLDVALVYALINFVTTVAILNLAQEAKLDP